MLPYDCEKSQRRRTFLKATRPATSTPAVATAPTRTSGLRALRAGNISSSTAMVHECLEVWGSFWGVPAAKRAYAPTTVRAAARAG